MRLHHLLEEINRTVLRFSEYKKRNVANKNNFNIDKVIEDGKWCLEFFKPFVLDSAQFDIQSFVEKLHENSRGQFLELIEYSQELMRQKINPLPYKYFCISLTIGDSEILIFISEIDIGEYEIFEFCMSEKQLIGGHCFLFKVDDKELKVANEERLVFETFGTDLKNGCEFSAFVFLVVCGMLQSKMVEVLTTPAPKRLNEKRIKKGKPPIGEIKEIRINYGGKRYMIDGSEEGGTHASPRLHWRRGHVRRLPTGKITNVRPTLVGEIKGEEPKMPTYKITSQVNS